MPADADLTAQLDRDLTVVKAGLRAVGVPSRVLAAISTRARLSGRRRTGAYQSNREPRWQLHRDDPQFGTEVDCKLIELRLLGMMLEFKRAPRPDEGVLETLARYIGQQPEPGTYRDILTLEHLDYHQFISEERVHGRSNFHLGHDDPTLRPKHVPSNVSWRSLRSNLIQGDMTLVEARTRLVELVARYFELGEVSVKPQPPA